jgi:hypothetical protein
MNKVWYIDMESTHGVKGLACVTDAFSRNTVGIGPDAEYEGTAFEVVMRLRRSGYTELVTDVPELRATWNAYEHALKNPPVRVIGAHDVEGYAMALYVAGFENARVWMFENMTKQEALEMYEKAQEVMGDANDGT